jgi:hypothetical protein
MIQVPSNLYSACQLMSSILVVDFHYPFAHHLAQWTLAIPTFDRSCTYFAHTQMPTRNEQHVFFETMQTAHFLLKYVRSSNSIINFYLLSLILATSPRCHGAKCICQMSPSLSPIAHRRGKDPQSVMCRSDLCWWIFPCTVSYM